MEGIYHLLSSQAIPFTLNVNQNSSESSLQGKDIETTCKRILCQGQSCSLEDLCNAANSDMIANNEGHESLNSCLALDLSANTFQSHKVTNIATEIDLFSTCDSSFMESRVDCCKEKFVDRNTCEYCGKVCAKPSILQKHLRAHTNERPFPCSKCDMHFKTKSNLYKHCKSRTHLNQAGHSSPLKGATDDISSEKPQILLVSSQASDAYENASNSCDGYNDVHTKNFNNSSFPSQILILDKNEGGKVVWKLLKDISGAPSTSVGVSQEYNKAIIEKSSQPSTEGFKSLVKSFSEKSPSKLLQPTKPHSYSFSNDVDLKHIPKLDKTMTNDDIQRRISLIISINNSIVDTPKEIKNHRLKKVVRNYSESNYVSSGLDSFNSKSATRANSITPTFDSDKVVSASQSSLSIVSRSTNFLSVPDNLSMQSFILEKNISDKQNAYGNRFHQLSLPTTSFHNVEHLKHFEKANSFADSCAAAMSNVSSSFCLTTFPPQPIHKHVEIAGAMPGDNILVHENNLSDSKSIDECNLSFVCSGESLYQTSPFISPRSSPSNQSLFNDQQSKHKRGRPKGSKNKLKALPTSSSAVHSIIPLIQITSAEDTTKECHWRKELKRHILMKRSLSNENPVEKEHFQPVTLSVIPLSSCAVSSPSIQQLSLSSMPIKKRRKTLTELGRGTAFGTTVDDNLEATSARKSLVKPLWSSDGSFNPNATFEESACYQSNTQKRKFNQSESLSISSCADRNCIQSFLESCTVVCSSECFSHSHQSLISHGRILGHKDVQSKSCISHSSGKLSEDRYNFSASSGSNMLALNVHKDLGEIGNQCVLIPTQYVNKAADSANDTSSSSQNFSNFLMLSWPPTVQNTKVANSLINSITSTTQSSFLTKSGCTDSEKLTVKKSFDVINSDTISDVVSSHQNFQMKYRKLGLHPKYKKIDLDFGSDSNDVSNIGNTSSLHAEHSASYSQSSTSDCGLSKATSDKAALAVEERVRNMLDSEAAASLLDLSKSRQIPDGSLNSFQGYQNLNMHNFSSCSNVDEVLDSSIPSRSSFQSSTTTNKHYGPLSLDNCLLKADYFPNVSCLSSSLKNKVSCSITSRNVGFIEGKYTCSICQKVFSKEHYLVLHKNIHYMEKPHRCCKCQATFQTKWLLKRHLNMVHHLTKPCDPRPFKCVECRKAFRTRGHLTKHARSKLHSQKLTSSLPRNANSYERHRHHSSDSNNAEVDNLKVENGQTVILPISGKTFCVNDKKSQCANYSFLTFQGESHSDNVVRLHSQETRHSSSENSDKHSIGDNEPLNSQLSVVMNCGYEEQNIDTTASDDRNLFKSENQLKLSQIPDILKKLSILGKACQVSEESSELNTNTIETFTSASENLSSCNIPVGVAFSMNENQNPNNYVLSFSAIERTGSETTLEILSEGVQTFPCHVCHAEFQDMQLLLIHYKFHLEQRTHICTVCDAGFKDAESLISHTDCHMKKFWSSKSTQTSNHLDSEDIGAKFCCSQPVSSQRPDTVKQSVNLPKFKGSKLHHSQVEALSSRKLPASGPSSQSTLISGGIVSAVSLPHPIIQVSGLPPGLTVHGDTESLSDQSVGTSGVFSNIDLTGDPIAHLLLHGTVRNNKPSLLPDSSHFLPYFQPSGSSESDTAANSDKNVYLYCHEAGYFILANADSFVDSAVSHKKSFMTLPLPVSNSRPV